MTPQEAITLITFVLGLARDQGASGQVLDTLLDCLSALKLIYDEEKGAP